MLKRDAATAEVVDRADQGPAPADSVETLDELWSVIEELVFGNQFDRALALAQDARGRWASSSIPQAAYAWVVSVGHQTGQILVPALLTRGLRAAELALDADARDAVSWESRVHLLLALGRASESLDATHEAERMLPAFPPRLRAHRAEILLVLGRLDDAMAEAVRAVAAGDDEALRGQCATVLVDWLAEHLLPIDSSQRLRKYTEAVAVAAWCAHGVPEAEDLVRPHRLWAAQAGQRIYAGGWELRSFIAVLTCSSPCPSSTV